MPDQSQPRRVVFCSFCKAHQINELAESVNECRGERPSSLKRGCVAIDALDFCPHILHNTFSCYAAINACLGLPKG